MDMDAIAGRQMIQFEAPTSVQVPSTTEESLPSSASALHRQLMLNQIEREAYADFVIVKSFSEPSFGAKRS